MTAIQKLSAALMLIAVILIGLLTTACRTDSDRKEATATAGDTTESISATIHTDYESIYADESFQVFRSKQSLEELRESVLYQQPDDFTATVISDTEFLVSWKQNGDTLFSKEIFGTDGERLNDAYVIAVERRNDPSGSHTFSYPYPYHMVENSWILSETGDGYELTYHSDPFESPVTLKAGDTAFTDLVTYYQDQGCEVQEEGDNQSGGVMTVTVNTDSGGSFRILVTKDGDTFTMKYDLP